MERNDGEFTGGERGVHDANAQIVQPVARLATIASHHPGREAADTRQSVVDGQEGVYPSGDVALALRAETKQVQAGRRDIGSIQRIGRIGINGIDDTGETESMADFVGRDADKIILTGRDAVAPIKVETEV